MDIPEYNHPKDPEPRKENPSDINKELEEVFEKGDSSRLIERFTQLVNDDLAQQVYIKEKENRGVDPETARRTGVEAGEEIETYRPVNMFLLPLNEKGSGHLIIDCRNNKLDIYQITPGEYIEEKYQEFFENLKGPIYIPREDEDKSLTSLIERRKLTREKINLSFPEQLQIDTYGPDNQEECIHAFEQAIETAKEKKRRKEEFQKEVGKRFLEILNRFFSSNEE